MLLSIIHSSCAGSGYLSELDALRVGPGGVPCGWAAGGDGQPTARCHLGPMTETALADLLTTTWDWSVGG